MSCTISLDILLDSSNILLTVSAICCDSISSHILEQSWHCSNNTSEVLISCRQQAPVASSTSVSTLYIHINRRQVNIWYVSGQQVNTIINIWFIGLSTYYNWYYWFAHAECTTTSCFEKIKSQDPYDQNQNYKHCLVWLSNSLTQKLKMISKRK